MYTSMADMHFVIWFSGDCVQMIYNTKVAPDCFLKSWKRENFNMKKYPLASSCKQLLILYVKQRE